jgi:hypothetical protein
LKWTLLEEGPRIPGTSVPEWIKMKVGERVFEVFRNKEKIGPDGTPIGPAMKHPGERAPKTASRPMMEQAVREFKDGLSPEEARKIEVPQDWPKSEWSKAAQTDIPMSWLAAVLDQAEAQILFKTPDPRAKPLGIPIGSSSSTRPGRSGGSSMPSTKWIPGGKFRRRDHPRDILGCGCRGLRFFSMSQHVRPIGT